ncbi:MAG TPA: MoxR family ATPase [Chloroflexota bacterium]|nr:MoxR family ATPase [Chloroflexota bacterium]
MPDSPFDSIDALEAALQERGYIADRSLATALFLSVRLGKPLLLEGEAGVGKTEVAKVLADILNGELIRLQGYEGIDIGHAVYEWNYARQIMAIRLAEAQGERESLPDVFGPDFLVKRPILRALESHGAPPVLLLDELDRVDDEFEAFLLEVLSDFQVTIPEIGTVTAVQRPAVIITSNRTRELHDALKRRCLYHWIDYPTLEKEYAIVSTRVPEAPEILRQQVVRFIQDLREMDLYKVPGVAETLDWTRALVSLGQDALDERAVRDTLGVLLKNQEDVTRLQAAAPALVRSAAHA